MKVAAIQMVSTPDPEENLRSAERWIAHAVRSGCQWVALPEYFAGMGWSDQEKWLLAERPLLVGERPNAEAPTDGAGVSRVRLQHWLSQQAQQHGIWLVGGTIPVISPVEGKVYNRCTVWDPQGHLTAQYDKVHLFCFSKGSERYDEADALVPGSEAVACQTGPVRVGLSVCYDLRFPEHYRAMMQPPCDILCVPAAFTWTTGQAHWSCLLQARAIENLCHVVAPAQGGVHPNGRRTWGHAMVVGPWGEVLAVHQEGEGCAMAELDLTHQARCREQLPALSHARRL